jgi:hypothetical protein
LLLGEVKHHYLYYLYVEEAVNPVIKRKRQRLKPEREQWSGNTMIGHSNDGMGSRDRELIEG